MRKQQTIVVLDLSLTATGVVVLREALHDDKLYPQQPLTVLGRYTIKPPGRHSRGTGEEEETSTWNRRRYLQFAIALQTTLNASTIDAVVAEVTEHAYQVQGGKKSSKGIEYRAGYGLGRACGWLDAVMASHTSIPYHQISASTVKLRVAGSRAASKAAVKDGLETYFGYRFVTPHGAGDNPWTEAEIDALAVGVGWWRETFDGSPKVIIDRYMEIEKEKAVRKALDDDGRHRVEEVQPKSRRKLTPQQRAFWERADRAVKARSAEGQRPLPGL